MLNKAQIIGRVGRDPETRHMGNGDPVVNFSVATTDRWKDASTGEQKERTEWHSCTAYKRLAEIIQDYVKKGDLIYVEGSLKTNEFEVQGVKRTKTEIIASGMKMLGSKGDSTQAPAAQNQRQNRPAGPPAQRQESDDDIPF